MKKEYANGKKIYVISEDNGLDAAPMPSTENTFVGYGINVLDAKDFFEGLTAPLLIDTAYSNGSGKSIIDSSVMNSAEGVFTLKDTLDEAFSSLDVAVKVGTGSAVPFFSGSVETKYGEKKQLKSQSKFFNAVFSMATKKQTLPETALFASGLKEYIIPEVLKIINDNSNSPEKLFYNLGTHVILSDSIGGYVQINALYNSDTKIESSTLSAALDFKSSYVSGSGSTELTQEQKSAMAQTSIKVNANGGDVGLFSGLTYNSISDTLKEWGRTVKVSSDQTISNIYKTLPIWELANDDERKKAIEDDFVAKCKSIKSGLSEYFTKGSAPIIVSGSTYAIKNFHSKMALDGPESTDEIRLWASNNSNPQKWVAEESKTKSGYFSFKSTATNTYMTVESIGTGRSNSTVQRVLLDDKKDTDRQLFKVEKGRDGAYIIRSLYNGFVFSTYNDDEYGNEKAGLWTREYGNERAVVWIRHNLNCQEWNMIEI